MNALKEVTTLDTMTTTTTMTHQGIGIAMPARGLALGAWTTVDVVDAANACVIATSNATPVVLRSRTAVATKGHVAFVAYVPGTHAWSPPLC